MPETEEAGVQALGREGPPEEEMALHSSALTWRISKEPRGLHGVAKSQTGLKRLSTQRGTQWVCFGSGFGHRQE